jgi:hypothetical protein
MRARPALAFAAQSDVCARCDGRMLITKDALSRERRRCPTCDGVAAPKRVHPDQVFIPQTLIRASDLLPAIEPGQLRCQRCASGVHGRERFCPRCQPPKRSARRQDGQPYQYRPKACLECGAMFQPTGPRSRYCEAHT